MAPSSHVDATEEEVLEATIQHLYALGLRLEACLSLIDNETALRGIVDSSIDSLGEVIESLRSRIEELQSEGGRYDGE